MKKSELFSYFSAIPLHTTVVQNIYQKIYKQILEKYKKILEPLNFEDTLAKIVSGQVPIKPILFSTLASTNGTIEPKETTPSPGCAIEQADELLYKIKNGFSLR